MCHASREDQGPPKRSTRSPLIHKPREPPKSLRNSKVLKAIPRWSSAATGPRCRGGVWGACRLAELWIRLSILSFGIRSVCPWRLNIS